MEGVGGQPKDWRHSTSDSMIARQSSVTSSTVDSNHRQTVSITSCSLIIYTQITETALPIHSQGQRR